MTQMLCRLSGHRWGRILLRAYFRDVVSGQMVSWWRCGCGETFMSDGRWSGTVVRGSGSAAAFTAD
jgi:hypothetical protein